MQGKGQKYELEAYDIKFITTNCELHLANISYKEAL